MARTNTHLVESPAKRPEATVQGPVGRGSRAALIGVVLAAVTSAGVLGASCSPSIDRQRVIEYLVDDGVPRQTAVCVAGRISAAGARDIITGGATAERVRLVADCSLGN